MKITINSQTAKNLRLLTVSAMALTTLYTIGKSLDGTWWMPVFALTLIVATFEVLFALDAEVTK